MQCANHNGRIFRAMLLLLALLLPCTRPHVLYGGIIGENVLNSFNNGTDLMRSVVTLCQ